MMSGGGGSKVIVFLYQSIFERELKAKKNNNDLTLLVTHLINWIIKYVCTGFSIVIDLVTEHDQELS